MRKTYYTVFGILMLSAALFMGGCGGSQQEETTTAEETQKEETTEISAEESLAAENASLEAELEELRKAQEEESLRQEEESLRQEEESIKQEEESRKQEEESKAAELSEMGKLGLQDEPFAFEGILINLPIDFERPEGSGGFAHPKLSMSPRIYFDSTSQYSSRLPLQDQIRSNLKIYQGFEDFELYEETQIGGVDVIRYKYLSDSTSGDKILGYNYEFLFPDKTVVIKASYWADRNQDEKEMMENSMATLRVEGAEEEADFSSEEDAATAEIETDAAQGEGALDILGPINVADFEMLDESFEYEGIRVHFPKGFDISSRYENGSAQIVNSDFSGNYFFNYMDPADPDMITEDVITGIYANNYDGFDKLEFFGRHDVNGLDLIYAGGKVPARFGDMKMYLCYGYYFLDDKVVYLSFTSMDPALVASFLATLKTAEPA